MADVLPINFPIPGESVIASYDSSDIAEGTGIVHFNCFQTETSAGTLYKMSTQEVYSANIESNQTGDINTTLTANFDLAPFNLPKTIKGTAFVSLPFAPYIQAGSGFGNVTANIQKYDGSTATTIATVTSKNYTISLSENFVVLPVAIPETHFKKGDVLRLSIAAYCHDTDGSGTVGVTIAHDPKNRDGATFTPSTDPDVSTKCDFFCPFRIDI